MTKKTEDGVEAVSQEKIETVPHDFNREDLNEMRDRLNQTIEAVNNLLTK